MSKFTAKYASCISGVLSGFDRLVLRGTIRRLSFVEGVHAYLFFRNVLIKDFGTHAESITAQIKASTSACFKSLGLPVQYLASTQANKEEIARRIATELGITEGPICLLTSVEPCYGFDVYRNRETKHVEIVSRPRKCLHLYRYEIHPVFGFMHARIQTWFPFNVQICINGREWLARSMDREGMSYLRHDNCFLNVADFARAQALLDEQLTVNWTELLDGVLASLNPLHEQLIGDFCAGYYWSAHQSEWATDIVFNEPDTLRRLYPMLIRHGMTTLGSPDVMRFLGRKVGCANQVHGNFDGEVTTDIKTRQEGVRIKHRVNQNSVKAYDKAYSSNAAVLRAETTINNTKEFYVHRPKEGDPEGPRTWRVLRKGVADLYRRAQVSQASNIRYLDALASVDDNTSLGELMNKITRPTKDSKGKRVRALQPFEADDAALLEAIGRGEFALNGLRNRDITRLLYGTTNIVTPKEARRRSSRVTRQLRMLRAHGLIYKVQHTHRYQVSTLGRQVITALSTARQTPINQLLPKAA